MNTFVRIATESATSQGSVGVHRSWSEFNDNAKEGMERVSFATGLPLRWRGWSPVRPHFDSRVKRDLVLKRAVDVIFALLALFVLLPLLAIVAAAIKLGSRGPVLFRQPREGLDGRTFHALKFRSMRIDLCDVSGVQQTLKDDPRITPIGRFIRKTSIDELPQLFNVLRGDMSLVGPRPHVAGMYAGGMLYTDLVPYYSARLWVRPGITGWAQANGLRGETANAARAVARVDHDVAYIQNFSLWLDFKILLLTVRNEFFTGSGH